MKTLGKLTVGRILQQLVFALVCLTLLSAGWAAKVRVDQLSRLSDELKQDFTKPSEVYLWHVAKQKAAAGPHAAPKLEIKDTQDPSAPISKAD